MRCNPSARLHTHTNTERRARAGSLHRRACVSCAPTQKQFAEPRTSHRPMHMACRGLLQRTRARCAATPSSPVVRHRPGPARQPLHLLSRRAPSASGQLRGARLRGCARRGPSACAAPAHRARSGPAAPAAAASSVLVVGAQYEAGRLRRGRLARRAAAAAGRGSCAFHLPHHRGHFKTNMLPVLGENWFEH